MTAPTMQKDKMTGIPTKKKYFSQQAFQTIFVKLFPAFFRSMLRHSFLLFFNLFLGAQA
jgi:hypothetical protein